MFVLTYDSNVLAVSEERAHLEDYKESLMGPTREYLQKLEEFEKGAEGRLYVEQEIIRDYLHRQIQAIKEFDTYQVENKNPWHDFVGEKYSEDYIQQRKRNIIERVVHSYRHLFYEGHEKVLGDLLDLTKVTEPPPKLHSTRPTIRFEDFYDESSFKIQEVPNIQSDLDKLVCLLKELKIEYIPIDTVCSMDGINFITINGTNCMFVFENRSFKKIDIAHY